MNKKNLISIFIILICVLFISNGVFAETPQNFIKINSVNVTFPDSSNTRTCAVTINYSGEVKYASNIINSWLVVSGTFYHHPHFLIAPKAIDSATKQAYLEKLADFSKRFWRNNSASYTYTVNNKSVKIYKPNVTMAGLGVNSSYTTNITPCLDYSEIEVIAFVPPHANLTNYDAKWDNVMTTNGNDFDLQRQRVEIVNNINRNPRYYVNLDNKTASVNAPTGGSQSNTSTVNCSTNCSGYTKSTTYPTSSVTVGGQSLSRGQVCYKCNDSGTMADRCNPFNGQKSGFTLNLASYPDLKTEICPNVGATNTSGSSGTPAQNTDAGRGSGGTQTPAECPAEYSMTFELYPNQKFKCVVEGTIPRYQSCSVTNGVVTISNVLSFENNSDQFRLSICSSIVQENQPTSNTVASNTPQNTLEILNNSNLSDINFSLNNTNWYIVNKIDNPESYILGNKTQDKNLSINLDSFNEGPIYAIISTANKKTEIEAELKQIYQTGAFTNYVRQTGTNQFKIDATFTGFSKLEYSLDNSKNLKINIKRENTLENIVLIFMQKSTDKVNLVYTNLYSLDNKSQSLFNYCMVNRNIVNFYCKGHNCSSNASCLSSGRWDFDPKIFEGLTPLAVTPSVPVTPPAVVTPPVVNPVQPQSTFTGNCSIDKQVTVEEYITCLRNNIETVSLTRSYALVVGGRQQGSAIVGNTLINNKYNTNRLCETSQSFNDAVFTGAKNANLTEEETAQLWARLASESGCNSGVGCGDYCDSHGIAQINMTGWNSNASYNLIKPYLINIDSSKYDTFAKFQSKLLNVTSDVTSAVEISIAINKYHKSVILNKSRNATKPFTDLLDKTYDHNDAIDMQFATAYTYTGVAYADHFSDGIKVGNTRYQGVVYPALHKMGYYLTYKHMIYNCHKTVTTNAFVTSYKTKYNGTYCR